MNQDGTSQEEDKYGQGSERLYGTLMYLDKIKTAENLLQTPGV